MIKYGGVLDYRTAKKAVVGKKYVFEDCLRQLQEAPKLYEIQELTRVDEQQDYPFETSNNCSWQFCREVIEEEVLMTNRQLAEWLDKENGQKGYLKNKEVPEGGIDPSYLLETYRLYDRRVDDEPCDEDIRIRSWDSNEWVVPTVDIYERDCNGGV